MSRGTVKGTEPVVRRKPAARGCLISKFSLLFPECPNRIKLVLFCNSAGIFEVTHVALYVWFIINWLPNVGLVIVGSKTINSLGGVTVWRFVTR